MTAMANHSDRSLVLGLQERERAAWGRAYDQFANDVFTFIAHLLRGDMTAAEEVHQETWLAALAGIDAFDADRGELRAWIFGIARRLVALHFRRRGAGRSAECVDSGQDKNRIDDNSILPSEVITLIERGDAVRAALAELGMEPRRVLLGKYVDGRSVNDLAEELGRSPKAVESLLSRARARMRSLLQWYFDNERVSKDVEP